MVNVKETVDEQDLEAIEFESKHLGYKIIDYKGETSYGIAMCLYKITKAIFNNENIVLNVSSPVDDIYISMPSVICKDGIKGTMKINFTAEEKEHYDKSVDIIKNAIKELED